MRQITITFANDRGFAVTEQGRTADRLAWDEMLGQIAALTHSKIGIGHYTMLTVAEYHAQEDKYGLEEGRLHFDERGVPRDPAEPNAAAELLKAAESFMAFVDPIGDSTDMWAKDMRVAIARAKGQA